MSKRNDEKGAILLALIVLVAVFSTQLISVLGTVLGIMAIAFFGGYLVDLFILWVKHDEGC